MEAGGRRSARGAADLRRGHRPLRQRLELLATDAAYNSHGDLEALPYFGGFIGYTHRWLPDWRSTATYGYVDVNGKPSQGPNAYHQTKYASVNLIWQMRERLSVGVEGLYGDNQKESGHSGDDFRTQVGVAYSLF